MRPLFSVIIVMSILISSISCKKDGGTDSSSISSPFTVKYEVTANKPITNSGGGFQYTNSAMGLVVDFNPTLPYTRTVTVTSTNRPFFLWLYGNGVEMSSAGNVTGKIFINGAEKASVTIPVTEIAQSGIFLSGMLDVKYVVQ